MGKKIFDMLSKSIKEFNSFCDIDEKKTIEMISIAVEAYCMGITLPKNINTKDELIIHTKGLALWFSICTHNEASSVLGDVVEIIDNKTNPNMEGLKHYVGTFEKNKKEIGEKDLLKILFIIGRIKSGLLGTYSGTVAIEGLLVDNINYNYLFIAKITELSILNGVNFGLLFKCLISVSFFEIHIYSLIDIDKIEIAEQQKKNINSILEQHSKSTYAETYLSILQTVSKNFKKIIEIKQKSSTSSKVLFPELSQEVLENSYNAVKDALTLDNVKKLPLAQYQLDFDSVIEDVKYENAGFDDLFTNPNRLQHLKSGNHYMSYLVKDTLTIKDDEVVFKNHTEALMMGYTQKAVQLSVNKESTLRELKRKLKQFKKQPLEDSEDNQKMIIFIEALIEIINQKKYANMVPFKHIAKHCGITKNQAKQYAKQFLRHFSIRPETFDNHFDNVKRYDLNEEYI